MHKPTVDLDIHTLLATMNSNGSEDHQEGTGKLEEFDVYVEEDRITVIKRPERQAQVIEAVKPPQTQPQPYFASVSLTISLLLIFYLVASAFITTFFPPVVTVMIIPKSQTLTLSGTLQLGRLLPPIIVSQSQTVPTTGKGHQDARAATGSITFYNGQFQSVTIGAGTVLTGADGIEIITDETALIPAASPPIFGQATVAAHAIRSGSIGNIVADDINEACCAASIFAKNTQAFIGGQDKRDFSTVSQQDLNKLSTQLTSATNRSMQGALNAQVKQTEELLTLPCSRTVTPNHNRGDEAKDVTVTVSETCSAAAYSSQAVEAKATAILTAQAGKKLGTGYSLIGNVHVSEKQATVTHAPTPLVFLSFHAQGTWVYALSYKVQQQIKVLIAGKAKQDALHILMSQPGIERAAISWGEDTRLPKNGSYIHIRIFVV